MESRGAARDPAILSALRQWRREEARGQGWPAFRVFSNAVLERIAQQLPKTLEEFRQIPGVGPQTVEHFGSSVLAVLQQAGASGGPSREQHAEGGRASASPPAVEPEVRPSYYWTWKLLSDGYRVEEIVQIRRLDEKTVLEHATRAVEEGCRVEMSWFVHADLLPQVTQLLNDSPQAPARALLAQLPASISSEHVELLRKCRAVETAAEAS